MSSRVAAVWNFHQPSELSGKRYEVVFRSSLHALQSVGRFVRAFLAVEPIFLKRY